MALKVNTQVQAFGRTLDFPAAYLKVETVNADKNHVEANLMIRDQADGTLIKSKQVYFDADMNGPNFIKQAYLHLKTLPEFSSAEDV